MKTCSTNLHDFEDESRVLEIVFEAEVDLSDVFCRLRIVDVHVHQGYGTILPKGHLHVSSLQADPDASHNVETQKTKIK